MRRNPLSPVAGDSRQVQFAGLGDAFDDEFGGIGYDWSSQGSGGAFDQSGVISPYQSDYAAAQTAVLYGVGSFVLPSSGEQVNIVSASSVPPPTSAPNLNTIFKVGSQLLRYVAQPGSPGMYYAQPLPGSGIGAIFSSPIFLVGVGVAALLLLTGGKEK